MPENPCLCLAIDRLKAIEPEHYALWVVQAPFPSGYGHHDRLWPESLTEVWQAWQEMFSLRGLPDVPRAPSTYVPPPLIAPSQDSGEGVAAGQGINYTARLMQHLGTCLWQWLFDGPIKSSLDQSQGIAIGQRNPLRLRLDIRDPNLIELPWEIMQPQPGKQAISLSQTVLFSRTTSQVEPLPLLRTEQSLRVLLVLGQEVETNADGTTGKSILQLEREAETLSQVLQGAADTSSKSFFSPMSVQCEVKALIKPDAADLIAQLETGQYNVLFYAGHGVPAPDGGLLFLRPGATINGTELAQVLTRCQVKLAVFNACWGAQSDRHNQHPIPRSSLAEVLIHHGVPAVLGMRDSIADEEALSFIKVFAQALLDRRPIDAAVAIARQQLLTLYRFNQPAWSLPVLYMHPQFDGELIKPLAENMTEIPPTSPNWLDRRSPSASLRSLSASGQVWPIRGGLMRIGSLEGNDLVLREPGISRKHAEIFYRDSSPGSSAESTYFLRDFSRFGTLVLGPDGWQKIHRQDVPLQSKTQLRFGSSQNQPIEFCIDE